MFQKLDVQYTENQTNQSDWKSALNNHWKDWCLSWSLGQSFGHLMQRPDSLEKNLMLGKIEEEKGTTEDEMVGWHHWLSGHEFEQTPGESEGQGSLACYTVHGVKKSWTELSYWTVMQKVRQSYKQCTWNSFFHKWESAEKLFFILLSWFFLYKAHSF